MTPRLLTLVKEMVTVIPDSLATPETSTLRAWPNPDLARPVVACPEVEHPEVRQAILLRQP